MPQFWNFSTDAERTFNGIKLPPLVGNEINIRVARGAMDVSQPRSLGRALKLKIRFQILCRENISERFAPDDTTFSHRVFLDASAVACSPQFFSKFFHLRITLRKIREAWRMLRSRA